MSNLIDDDLPKGITLSKLLNYQGDPAHSARRIPRGRKVRNFCIPMTQSPEHAAMLTIGLIALQIRRYFLSHLGHSDGLHQHSDDVHPPK